MFDRTPERALRDKMISALHAVGLLHDILSHDASLRDFFGIGDFRNLQ